MAKTAVSPAEVTPIPVTQLEPNPWNRTVFDPKALEELAASIKVGGIDDPLTVRKKGKNSYEIASGHRRWLAAQKAGLKEVPCVVRDLTDEKVAEMNIELNVQRENLPTLELARMVKAYMDDFHKTQQDAAARFGKSQAWVSELTGFLTLAPELREIIKALIIGWIPLRSLKAASKAVQLQVAAELKSGTLKPENIEKRCSHLSLASNPPSGKRVPKPSVSKFLKEEGCSFTREGDSILLTARLPWGPTLDLDSEMAKLRAGLLLWISQQQPGGDAGAGVGGAGEGPASKTRPSNEKGRFPSPGSRLPTPASAADDPEEEAMRRAGITRAPAWPYGKFENNPSAGTQVPDTAVPAGPGSGSAEELDPKIAAMIARQVAKGRVR